jgi:hypothetical protein
VIFAYGLLEDNLSGLLTPFSRCFYILYVCADLNPFSWATFHVLPVSWYSLSYIPYGRQLISRMCGISVW